MVVTRTTRDRWISNNYIEDTESWRGIADADWVLAAAADSYQDPSGIEVHLLRAADVRTAFDAARKARIDAGHIIRDNTIWVALDRQTSNAVSAVGGGLIDKAVWTQRFDLCLNPLAPTVGATPGGYRPLPPTEGNNGDGTALCLSPDEAKRAVAAYYGVAPDAVQIQVRF